MSSPLSIFRKYQKLLMAIFGVGLMIAFTVSSGAVNEFISGSRGNPTTQPVVRLKTGDLKENDLQNMRYSRMLLQNFMRNVNYLAMERGAQPKSWLGIPDADDEQSLLQTLLLSNKAREMGMAVTDESVIHYLEAYSEGKIQQGEFAGLLNNISQGRMSQNQFFNAMRNELLALRFMELFQRGVDPLPPATSWELYQRLYRQVSIEAIAFDANNFLSKVPEPTEPEIAALFEEGKDRYPLPSEAEPGFKRRKKVALQYVKADLQPFLDQEEAKITDQAIQEFYEANKQEFRDFSVPSQANPAMGTAPATDGTQAMPATTPAVENAMPVETPPATSPDSATPAPSEPAPPQPPAEQMPAEQPPAEQPPAEQPPAEAPPTADSGSAPGGEPQFLQDDPGDSGPKVNEAPVTTEATAGEPAAATDPAATPAPATTEASGADAVVAPAEPAAAASASETDAVSAAPEGSSDLGTLPEAAGGNTGTSQRSEYKPLEQVSDAIRERLARPLATRRMETAVNAVRAAMRGYYSKYIAWDVSESRDRQPQPTPPDLAALAAEQGLTAASIPLVDVLQLQETDPVTGEPRYEISQSFDVNSMPFAQIVFARELPAYSESTIRGAVLDTEYLFWKTQQVDEQVPTLDECRADVIKAIKLREAWKLADAAARAEADRLRSGGQSLTDAFRGQADRPVISTGSFSWMTPSMVPYLPPQLSRVPGIQYAGVDFMREVFQLPVGGIGVASDNPRRVAYVIYLKSEDSDAEQLRKKFLATGVSMEVMQLAQLENRDLLKGWYEAYEKEMGVKWERDPLPDSRRR